MFSFFKRNKGNKGNEGINKENKGDVNKPQSKPTSIGMIAMNNNDNKSLQILTNKGLHTQTITPETIDEAINAINNQNNNTKVNETIAALEKEKEGFVKRKAIERKQNIQNIQSSSGGSRKKRKKQTKRKRQKRKKQTKRRTK